MVLWTDAMGQQSCLSSSSALHAALQLGNMCHDTMTVAMQVVKAEMVLWTAGFVLLTLIINAPLLPFILKLTGLNTGTIAWLRSHVGCMQQLAANVSSVGQTLIPFLHDNLL